MSIEAMKQALEALEIVQADAKTTPNAYEAQRQAVTTLRAAIADAEKQEPVAWGAFHESGRAVIYQDKATVEGAGIGNVSVVPLYANSPAAQPDHIPDAGKMVAALQSIADGSVTQGKAESHAETVLAYQNFAREVLDRSAEAGKTLGLIVGWMHPMDFGRDAAVTGRQISDEQLPLYTSPPAPEAPAQPVTSLQCANCHLTIESLNDKVMHLLAQRQPLTDEQLEQVFPAIATYHEANKTLYRSIARAIEAAHGITGEKK